MVYLPDSLYQKAKESSPKINFSAVFREAIENYLQEDGLLLPETEVRILAGRLDRLAKRMKGAG